MNTISKQSLSSLGLSSSGKNSVIERQQAEEKAQKDKLGQADFLLMMTQQLKNQDPLNPMDNGAFLAQLAQISTVQGLGDLNKKADQFLGTSNADQALRGAALIGRRVEVPGGSLELGADGGAQASATATDNGPVTVTVQDAGGNPVRTLTLADGAAGPRRVEWDGKDAAGNRLPAGDYRFAASQIGADGKPTTLATHGTAKVQSISLDKDGATLNLVGGKSVPLAEVLRIS